MIAHIKLDPGAKSLTKTYSGDAGYDLACIDHCHLESFEMGDKLLIRTGIHIALPPGIWGYILPRSSTLSRYGLQVIPAVIDNGYTGELFVQAIIAAKTRQFYWIEPGARIAQFIPQYIVQLTIKEVDELDRRERGESGFGSTGV